MSEPLLARRGLSLERLESFCRVAEAGSLVKAAQRDPARQSLYSRQIRELEEFFGTELVERDGRGIRLTSAGKQLALLAREQFAALRGFQEESQKQPVCLSIAAGNSVLEWVITPLLPRLLEQLGQVSVVLLNRRSPEIVRDLQELKLDIGIVRETAVPKGLKRSAFLKLSYAVFVPERLIEGLSDSEALKRLSQFPLALAESESFQRQLADAAKKAKLNLRATVSCSSFTQAAELAAGGTFVAILPAVAEDRLRERGCRMIKPSFLDSCSRQLTIAWNSRLAAVRPVVSRAVDCLKSASAD